MTLLFGPALSEAASRGIPWLAAEYEWAHDRPERDRVRTPAVGDTVCYRHDAWGEVTEATVVWVQPPDDIDDPHLWTPTLDEHGAPVLLEGRAVMCQRFDPWPVLRLKTRYGLGETREARLRGSPGWLPLDYQARRRPVPQPSSASQPAPQFGAPPRPAASARQSPLGLAFGPAAGPPGAGDPPGPAGPQLWEG